MKAVQFKTLAYEDAIEWIPFDRLDNIIKIGEGGFGSIYKATWLDGIRRIEKIIKNDNFSYKRSREQNSIVALKTLPGFKTNQNSADFLSVFKNHMQCKLYCNRLQIYGLTYNLKANEYLMAFQYADGGNICKFLKSNFNKLTWEFKLKQLRDISKDLDQIHNAGYIHANLHSGNILHNRGTSYVSDLGLSKKAGENNAEDIVFGVIPYVAPEVLSGKQFTKRADIYSFGIIMAEITTGQRPFDGYKFDLNLVIEICNGLRPKFAPETPDCYIELANHCMNTDPLKRPIAWTVYCTIDDWIKQLALDDEHEIKKQFLNADKAIKTLPIIS
ncbi:kinase-like domain-containing protein, partial [Gigaspora rosea]